MRFAAHRHLMRNYALTLSVSKPSEGLHQHDPRYTGHIICTITQDLDNFASLMMWLLADRHLYALRYLPCASGDLIHGEGEVRYSRQVILPAQSRIQRFNPPRQ